MAGADRDPIHLPSHIQNVVTAVLNHADFVGLLDGVTILYGQGTDFCGLWQIWLS